MVAYHVKVTSSNRTGRNAWCLSLTTPGGVNGEPLALGILSRGAWCGHEQLSSSGRQRMYPFPPVVATFLWQLHTFARCVVMLSTVSVESTLPLTSLLLRFSTYW